MPSEREAAREWMGRHLPRFSLDFTVPDGTGGRVYFCEVLADLILSVERKAKVEVLQTLIDKRQWKLGADDLMDEITRLRAEKMGRDAGGAMTDERRQAIVRLAEGVMGWRVFKNPAEWYNTGRPEDAVIAEHGRLYRFYRDVWNPFDSWADAGMLVEKLGIQLEPTDTGHWGAIARVDEWHMKKWVRAKSPTEAISLAALAAVKVGT